MSEQDWIKLNLFVEWEEKAKKTLRKWKREVKKTDDAGLKEKIDRLERKMAEWKGLNTDQILFKMDKDSV